MKQKNLSTALYFNSFFLSLYFDHVMRTMRVPVCMISIFLSLIDPTCRHLM